MPQKTNLTPQLFVDVPIPSHERGQSLQCVLGRGDWQYQSLYTDLYSELCPSLYLDQNQNQNQNQNRSETGFCFMKDDDSITSNTLPFCMFSGTNFWSSSLKIHLFGSVK
jgi:hypothetical protein